MNGFRITDPLLRFGAICFIVGLLLILFALVILPIVEAAPLEQPPQPAAGTIRIARPPAYGWQTITVQEDGKNMLEGGWHTLRVRVCAACRWYMGDRVSLVWRAGRLVGVQ